jgi:membrane protein YdbS with pleckstrin-like domain
MPSRYIVHGTDESGQPVRKVIEAESAAAASTMATNIGVNVRGVEVDAGQGAAPAPVGQPTPTGPEQTVWTGSPSQWTNIKWYAFLVLGIAAGVVTSVLTANPLGLLIMILPMPWVVWNFLKTKTVRITLTTERLRIESGILSRRIEEIELYRVKDTELAKAVWQRLLGLGTVHLVTSDPTMPRITLESIKNAVAVRESLRQQVERVRRLRGVRELDVADQVLH